MAMGASIARKIERNGTLVTIRYKPEEAPAVDDDWPDPDTPRYRPDDVRVKMLYVPQAFETAGAQAIVSEAGQLPTEMVKGYLPSDFDLTKVECIFIGEDRYRIRRHDLFTYQGLGVVQQLELQRTAAVELYPHA